MEKRVRDRARAKLPQHFVIRRLHSILGLWLILYLMEHLLVNSQMAFLAQDSGATFIRLVNKIHDLPYLRLVEIVFIGLPFLFHGWYGWRYANSAKINALPSRGTEPSLPQYRRNRAFTWQRITSWLLIPAILIHVIQMRFIEYPGQETKEGQTLYTVALDPDAQLTTLAQRLQVHLEEKEGRWIATSPTIGISYLLVIRETFKKLLWVLFYSILVIGSTYHAFNGLFTLLISWGVILTQRSQRIAKGFANGLMLLFTLLGLGAVWGTYLTLLFQGVL